MDLLEYQAKELFREMGIPVLPSQRIDYPKDLKGLKIPYPVVLKSQVRQGGRGKAGGVRFVENTIDAVAAAQTIFNLPIMGEYPEVLLAEAKYDADREFYLAVTLDRTARRPVLLGSTHGGIKVESSIEQMQQVVVDQAFSPFYARRLALKMGLKGQLIQAVSTVVEKMYRLFRDKDLDLLEINPLGISSSGEVMALDGKVTVNDAALNRHPDLQVQTKKSEPVKTEGIAPRSATRASKWSHAGVIMELDGNLGIICNGAGLAMATLDLVYHAKGKPANFLNIGGEFHVQGIETSLQDRLKQGLELMTHNKNIKVVLVNILSHTFADQQVATAIAEYLHQQPHLARLPQLVVRLISSRFDPTLDQAKAILDESNVLCIENLDEAIAQAVTLSKAASKNP